jgi:hypothetical protein
VSAWAARRELARRSSEDEPAALEELRSPGPPWGAFVLGVLLGAGISQLRARPSRG